MGRQARSGPEGWSRSGLVVITLGAASNLALTFVPDVVPDRAAQVVVYCMTAVVVVVAPLWVYRELVESSRRLEAERRRMRGIEAVGSDYGREAAANAVWDSAAGSVLCFGVGLVGVSKEVERIADAAARGVRVDFVMVDPGWLREQPAVPGLMENFYDEIGFVARVEKARSALEALAARLADEGAPGRVRVHTYRSWVQQSATIADPWSDEPQGYVEFHLFRRRQHWVRLVASGFDGPRTDRPYVSHILREIDRLLGYDLARA